MEHPRIRIVQSSSLACRGCPRRSQDAARPWPRRASRIVECGDSVLPDRRGNESQTPGYSCKPTSDNQRFGSPRKPIIICFGGSLRLWKAGLFHYSPQIQVPNILSAKKPTLLRRRLNRRKPAFFNSPTGTYGYGASPLFQPSPAVAYY